MDGWTKNENLTIIMGINPTHEVCIIENEKNKIDKQIIIPHTRRES
jgi:hypothetical protein